jgi:hypothetical protein
MVIFLTALEAVVGGMFLALLLFEIICWRMLRASRVDDSYASSRHNWGRRRYRSK